MGLLSMAPSDILRVYIKELHGVLSITAQIVDCQHHIIL